MAFFPIPERDSRVIERILRGARDDFEILVKRYRTAVYAIAYSRLGNAADAEDATQESFIKAFRNLGSIRDKKKFGAWLMAVARNESTRTGRKAVAARPHVDAAAAEAPDIARRELHAILRQQVQALDTPYRDVLLLHYFSGLKVREIASLLEISKAAAGKRLERARVALGRRVVAELGPGLETEHSNPDGDRKIMAVVAGLPAATHEFSAPAGGKTLVRNLAIATLAGAAVVVALLMATPQREDVPGADLAVAGPASLKFEGGGLSKAPPTGTESSLDKAAHEEASEFRTPLESGAEDRGGVIEGHVFDSKTGENLVGVQILRESRLASGVIIGNPQRRTDADGRFRFENLEPGKYTFQLMEYYKFEGFKQTATLANGEYAFLEFPLSLGPSIAGRVVDEIGNPISGARIEAMTNQENRVRFAETGEDGFYRVRGFFGPGTGFEISVLKEGFAFQHRRDFALPESGLIGLDFALEPESTMSGTVVGEDGRPLNDVGLLVRPRDNSRPGLSTTGPRTGSDGAFTFSNLKEGSYDIIATAPGGRTYSERNKIDYIEIARAEHITGLVLVSSVGRGLTISGRVIDSSGEPVSNAMVYAFSMEVPDSGTGSTRTESTQTESDGTYVIVGLSEGVYGIMVSHFSGRPGKGSNGSAEAGAADIDFVLDSRTALRGFVAVASTGEPIPSFEIAVSEGLRDEIDHHALWHLKRFESENGEFHLTDLPAGDITLFVRAGGFAHELVPVLSLEPGEARDGVRVELSEGVTIEGRVLDPNGVPVSGASLFLGPLLDQQFLTHSVATKTDASGAFKMQVPPGASQTLTAHDTRYTHATVEVSLSSNPVDNVEIMLGEGGAVTGTVAFDSVLKPNLPFSVHQNDVHLGNFQTDGNGAFHIERLPAGPITIRAYFEDGGEAPVIGSTLVRDGEESYVSLQGYSGSAALEGTAEWIMPGEVSFLKLQAYVSTSPDSEMHFTESVANGDRYRFENLPEGPVRIEIQRIDSVTQVSYYAVKETTLIAGETVELDLLVIE